MTLSISNPPYLPLSKTCYFKDYTKEEFGYPEQVILAKEFRRLSNVKSTVLLSNSNSPLITDLYKDFNIMTIPTSDRLTATHQIV